MGFVLIAEFIHKNNCNHISVEYEKIDTFKKTTFYKSRLS